MARRRERAASRWAVRGAAALAMSAVAHAMVMASAGIVLRVATRNEPSPVEILDIDVATADAVPEGRSTVAGPARTPRRSQHRAPPSRPRAAASADVVMATTAANADLEVARFVLAAPHAAGDGAAAASRPGWPSSVRPTVSDGDPLREANVTVPARLLASTPVVYPPQARRAEIEVDLPMEIVVGVDGRVRAARGLTQVGYDLDQAALRSIVAYRFAPALRDGRPVPVRMRWTVQFRLR